MKMLENQASGVKLSDIVNPTYNLGVKETNPDLASALAEAYLRGFSDEDIAGVMGIALETLATHKKRLPAEQKEQVFEAEIEYLRKAEKETHQRIQAITTRSLPESAIQDDFDSDIQSEMKLAQVKKTEVETLSKYLSGIQATLARRTRSLDNVRDKMGSGNTYTIQIVQPAYYIDEADVIDQD